MKVFFYALFVHLSLNIFVFWEGWKILKSRKSFRTFFAAVFVLEFSVYLCGLLLSRWLPDKAIQIIGFIGTSWMLFLFYMTIAILFINLLFYAHTRKPFLPSIADRRRNRVKGSVFIVFFFLVATIMWRGNYNFNHPGVVHKEITIDKPAGKLQSLRVAMIADTHLGFLINKNYAQKYVRLIMAQKPDIILFAGDIIDAEIRPLIKENMGEELRQLHAPFGVYSCTGNHEYRNEAEEKIKWLNENGISMLRDSAVCIDSAFYVVGREDVDAPFARKPIKEILRAQHVDMRKPVIVLNHNPKYLNQDVEAGADLALYGHTHHGQFFPGNIYTDMIFEIAHGYKKKNHTHVYVTSGLGLAGPQYRIGTQSEIVMLDVRFK